MENKTIEKNEEIVIDIGRAFRAVMDRAWLVAAVTVLCAVITVVFTFFFITPQYEASAMFYVNNTVQSGSDDSLSVSSNDLTTSRKLVDSYIVILKTRETLNEVIEQAGVDRTYRQIEEMITAAAVDGTEIIKVTVTSHDPAEAEKIANAIAFVMPQRISMIIEGSSAKVVDFAVVPTKPSSPSYIKNAVMGFLLGFVLSVGAIALKEIFDTTIRTEEDVTQSCRYPVLTAVPDVTASGKTGGKKGGSYGAGKIPTRQPVLLAENVSFTASEAYKLLRTKIQFSFTDDKNCRVIGVSSALSGEGKSLTAINLAYSLSQLNHKVILVDCDMRRPTLAEKLRIRKKPGLSNYLTGQCRLMDVIQRYEQGTGGGVFDVIAAGQNPPNPVELLSSGKMGRMLEALDKAYQYVIIDLPPVGEVSDAVAVAKKTDGILLVVRQNLCSRQALSNVIHQFEFMDARILGIVLNGTSEHTGKYGKYHTSSYAYNDRSVDTSGNNGGKKS